MNNQISPLLRTIGRIGLVFGLSGLLVLLSGLLLQSASLAQAWSFNQRTFEAAPTALIRYAAVEGTDFGNDCAISTKPCATVQRAVDVATPDDEIRVAAGTYTGVQVREGITQVVYISQSATIRGGYTTTNWMTSDPETYATILDAQGQGRVVVIFGTRVTLEGLQITGGDTQSFIDQSWPSITGRVGGGLHISGPAIAIISDCQIYSNTAAYSGGGLFAYSSFITVTHSRVSSNSLDGASSYGGGIYAQLGTSVFDSNVVFNNSAVYGGGIYLGLESLGGRLSENRIYNNRASKFGGGLILISMQTPDIVISRNVFSQNVGSAGGGMWLGTGISVVKGNLFISNTVSQEGGGAYIYYGSDALSHNTFMSNTAGMGGGVALTGATSELSDNQIIYNNGNLGGGVGIWDGGTVTLTANVIAKNTSYYGGGVGQNNTAAVLTDNILAQNAASIRGGAMDVVSSSVQLARNVIMGNSSSNGAAIYLWPPSDATLTNNVLADHAGLSPALIIDSSTARLLHNTLVRNGIAISVNAAHSISGVADMTNTLLANNIAAINVSAGSAVTINGVLWSNNTYNAIVDGNLSVTHELTGDPRFAADGYHILSGSLAIDAGVPAGVADDIDSEQRPSGPAADIGADEWLYPNTADLSVTQQILPLVVHPNENVTYTIAYRNVNGLATGTVISAEIPAGLTNLNVISSGAVLTTVQGVTYTWHVADLPSGAGGLITITAVVMPGHAPQVLTSTVSITASQSDFNPANNTANAVLTIANRAPLANAGPDQSALVDAPITLDGSGSTDPDGHFPLAYEWQQINGSPVALSSRTISRPIFTTPTAPAVLAFSLIVSDSMGLRSLLTDTVVITASNRPITALLVLGSSPTTLGQATWFTATTYSSNAVYAWDFGDGALALSNPISHTYSARGYYTAIVTATNGANSLTATLPVTITNLAPVALAGSDQNVSVNSQVDLNGSSSYDQDGHVPLTYHWAQNGGPAVLLSSIVISRPAFMAPATPSVLTFTLRVSDARGLSSAIDTTVVHVNDQAITGLQAENNSPTRVGRSVSFTATLVTGSNVLYQWNFGDGTVADPTNLLLATHIYSRYGSFTAILTATNQSGISVAESPVMVQPYSIYLPSLHKNP